MVPTKTIEALVRVRPGSRWVLVRLTRSLAVALALVLGPGCGGTTPAPVASKPAAPAAPLHRGPLTDYVAAAGLRWMLVGKPRDIAQHPAFAEAIELLLPEPRLKAFSSGSGVDLETVGAALVAGFDLGTLYLLQATPPAAARASLKFQERLLQGSLKRPHPELERASGLVGSTPQALVRFDPIVAISVGDPTLTRVVEAFARRKLRRSPVALRGAALSTLAPPPQQALATFYVPGPFTGEWAQGARGLLADAVALSIAMTPSSRGHARFTVQLAGDVRREGADEMVKAFHELVQTPTGRLLGLDQPTSPTAVHEPDGRLVLDVELEVAPIARGLRAAVIADVWEIMQTRPRATN